jgi:hypothetical protein
MANGKQKGEKNLRSFQEWAASKRPEEFGEYVFRGQLNRNEIAKEIGFGKSALTQNPNIKDELAALEDTLRSKGILPPLRRTEPQNSEQPHVRDRDATKRAQDKSRLNTLEQQNASLLAENRALKEQLRVHNILEEFLLETGRLPR